MGILEFSIYNDDNNNETYFNENYAITQLLNCFYIDDPIDKGFSPITLP